MSTIKNTPATVLTSAQLESVLTPFYYGGIKATANGDITSLDYKLCKVGYDALVKIHKLVNRDLPGALDSADDTVLSSNCNNKYSKHRGLDMLLEPFDAVFCYLENKVFSDNDVEILEPQTADLIIKLYALEVLSASTKPFCYDYTYPSYTKFMATYKQFRFLTVSEFVENECGEYHEEEIHTYDMYEMNVASPQSILDTYTDWLNA